MIDPFTFQRRVANWVRVTLPPEDANNLTVRCDRLLEEVLEALQAVGYPKERIDKLRDYVFSRDKGEINQEVGGVMVTLAAFCEVAGVDMHPAAEIELDRCWENRKKIRDKQALKRDKLGPLP